MPNSDMHRLLAKLIFGRDFKKIDNRLDAPAWESVWHYNAAGQLVFAPLGPNHRQMNHDPISAMAVGMLNMPENPMMGAMGAMFHLCVDQAFDGLQNIASKNVKRNNPPKTTKRSSNVRRKKSTRKRTTKR